jgi:DNA-binding NtrC family response regulator
MTSAKLIPDRKRRILLAEDEPNLRRPIVAYLRKYGYEVLEAHNAPTAQQTFLDSPVDLVLTDLKMPDSEQDGFDVLKFVVDRSPKGLPRIPVLILTAYGTADKAIEALSQGAYNLISKPCDLPELKTQVEIALRERDEALEALANDVAEEGRFGIIGKTPQMGRIFDTIATVADSPSTVLVTGESGTGKELVARALHHHSSRVNNPFVKINCAAIPENLLESELFGHERGAFTGAVATRPGKFEQAHTGTLFLDEIGELKPELQVKLLRILQEQEFERVGGMRTIKVDVRLVAATNRDLMAQVRAGQFREDLYYRLNVVPIALPALRERREDIPLLVEFFRKKYNRRLEKAVSGVDRTLLEVLGRYPWPGNIRELENVMERMILFAESTMLGVRHLPPELLSGMKEGESGRAARETPPAERIDAPLPPGEKPALPPQVTLKDFMGEFTSRIERDLIQQALAESGWNVTRTAERLGLSRKGLQVKMKELDIRKPGG